MTGAAGARRCCRRRSAPAAAASPAPLPWRALTRCGLTGTNPFDCCRCRGFAAATPAPRCCKPSTSMSAAVRRRRAPECHQDCDLPGGGVGSRTMCALDGGAARAQASWQAEGAWPPGDTNALAEARRSVMAMGPAPPSGGDAPACGSGGGGSAAAGAGPRRAGARDAHPQPGTPHAPAGGSPCGHGRPAQPRARRRSHRSAWVPGRRACGRALPFALLHAGTRGDTPLCACAQGH